MHLLDHAAAIDAMNRKYGAFYVKGTFAPSSYAGMDGPVSTIDVRKVTVTTDRTSDPLAREIV